MESENYLQWLDVLIQRYPVLAESRVELLSAFQMLRNLFKRGGKLLVCGNGGSAADAEHISSELMKGFLKKRPLPSSLLDHFRQFDNQNLTWVTQLQTALPVICLTTNGALATAISNDLGETLIFAQQILGYGNSGDVLLAISTSGNSSNILNAVLVAKALGLQTIGLTGFKGGKLSKSADLTIKVPAVQTPQIQELHLPVYHALCAGLEAYFFED